MREVLFFQPSMIALTEHFVNRLREVFFSLTLFHQLTLREGLLGATPSLIPYFLRQFNR